MTYIACSICGGGMPGKPCTCWPSYTPVSPKYGSQCPHCKESTDRIKALEAENARLREALKFYAAQENWISEYPYVDSKTDHDEGCLARAALEGKEDG